MRLAIAAVAALIAIPLIDDAKADPYHWCAEDGGARGGGTNCYFVTLDQCRAAISGNGGFCAPNNFYDGAAATPGEAPRRNRSRALR